jgi:diaminohydroxyphosphoribosylaminopyrimidine deaminase/5-amino-6-(5-phosphoribosylamino)uracil reductase
MPSEKSATPSNFSPIDRVFMARAIALTDNGRDTATPNPNVGCVLVKDGIIVGEGWHERAGEAHAEVRALEKAGESARGATAYVTLEPCAHQGRTGPCTEVLVKAGVKRVVAALEDPFPQVNGRGLARLREAGVQVDTGLMADEAREAHKGFLSRVTRGARGCASRWPPRWMDASRSPTARAAGSRRKRRAATCTRCARARARC